VTVKPRPLEMNREELISFLRKRGYRITPQRLAICEEVLSAKNHPSAEQIYNKVSNQHPSISLTTIYHTLEMLKDLNLIDELRFDSSTSRYDPNTSIHANIICQYCNEIRDYESQGLKKNWQRIISEIGLEPIGQRMDIYIVCEKCKKKLKSGKD
jgi:Fur family peroxide stress response transcriptional regulator